MKFEIQKLEITDSTNDDALAAIEAGGKEGLVIWALSQRSGRGRQGRVWHSPEGNLYCSIVLKPKTPEAHWGYLSFVAALAMSDAVSLFLPQSSVTLKWPNDILVKTKKISGILLEARAPYIVLGMGLNIRRTPENILVPATSLHEEGALHADAQSALDYLLERLVYWIGILDTRGFPFIRTSWLERALRGQMRIKRPTSEGIVEIFGEFIDLDQEGGLVIKTEENTFETIHTGDVFF